MSKYITKLSKSNYFQPQGGKGFTLVEIIVVLFIISIIAIVLGPFVSGVISNLLEGRELSNREQQANASLERFVRDVRQSEDQTVENDGSTLILTLVNGENLEYRIDDADSSLKLTRNDGQLNVLARHIDFSSSFDIKNQPDGIDFSLVILNLYVNRPEGNNMEFTASAVPRGN